MDFNKFTPLAVLILTGSLVGQTHQPCVVTRMLDSCRVELATGEIVRLIGLQTLPHFSSNLMEPNSFPDSLLIGKSLWLESDDHLPEDFVYLWCDSLLLNRELLRRGLARIWDDTTAFKYQEVFLVAEHKARATKRGNWKFVAFCPAANDESTMVVEAMVYVTKFGKKYHRANCRLLSQNETALPLSQARRDYEPCRRCADSANPLKEPLSLQKNGKTAAEPCLAKTKKGDRCKRQAERGSKYCWQHRRK
jgi:hypothetical protein